MGLGGVTFRRPRLRDLGFLRTLVLQDCTFRHVMTDLPPLPVSMSPWQPLNPYWLLNISHCPMHGQEH